MAITSLSSLNAFLAQVKLDKALLELDESEAQQYAAPILRAAVIEHLRNGKSKIADAVRQAPYLWFDDVCHPNRESFLRKQARNSVWATDIEATVLAHMTGCSLEITSITEGPRQEPFCLYRATDKNAPVIRLTNRGRFHWYSDRKSLMDGNCLYNAFVLEIRKHLKVPAVTAVRKPIPPKTETTTVKPIPLTPPPITQELSQVGLFNRRQTIIKQQQAILDAAKARRSSSKKAEANVQQKTERLAHLSPVERKKIQEQIQADYELALILADETMSRPKMF